VNEPPLISKEQFFKLAENIYQWDLIDREKDLLEGMARTYTGSIVLESWELFQNRFPGHSAWEFEEWYNEILQCEEGDDYESEDE